MRLLSIIGGIWLLALAAFASDAGVSVIGFFVLVFGAIAFGIAWLIHVLRIFGRRTADSPAPSRWIWVMGPTYLATAVALGFAGGARGPLFRARFHLSEPALTREAQRLLQSPPPGDIVPGRVGLFFVQRGEVRDGQVRFITSSCGMVDSCGLVYATTSEPKRWQEDRFSSLGGRWWHVFEGF